MAALTQKTATAHSYQNQCQLFVMTYQSAETDSHACIFLLKYYKEIEM